MIEELGIKTLDDIDIKNKTVLVRVDFNSPIDPKTKKILDDTRIRIHAEKTIRELVNKEAKTIVMAHQGRLGDPDFTSLEQHSKILSKILGIDVKFVNDIFGDKALNAIKQLNPGEVLVLENVRSWKNETKKATAEEHSKTEMVTRLSPYINVFCIDAFAAAHRPHVSMIGFAPVVKHVVAGRVMEAEIRALYKVRNNPEKPCTYILGGAKAEDAAEVVDNILSQKIADYVLTGGLIANLFLFSNGINLGKPNNDILEKKGFTEFKNLIKELIDKYPENIILPIDLTIDVNGNKKDVKVAELPTNYLIKDIGSATIEKYSQIIKESKTVVMSGPMGIFEQKPFDEGTRKMFEAMASSNAYTLIGGGHTIAAAHKLGFLDKFSHVSTGGGALIDYLIKGTLPVIEVLKRYSK